MSRHYLKNRTIVSNSINEIIADAADYIGIQPVIHRYPTGSEFGTWDIPPRWDVREAWLKDEKGNVIASYKDHPLFLAPYSAPFSGRVSLDVLREHVSIHPTRRNAFFYEHRLAYHAQMRLKDWQITLPADVFESIGIRAPETALLSEYSGGLGFPLIIKGRRGAAGAKASGQPMSNLTLII